MPETMQPPVPGAQAQAQVPMNQGGAVPPAAQVDPEEQFEAETAQQEQALAEQKRQVQKQKMQNKTKKIELDSIKTQQEAAKLDQQFVELQKKRAFIQRAIELNKTNHEALPHIKAAGGATKKVAVALNLKKAKARKAREKENGYYSKVASAITATLDDKYLVDESSFNSLVELGPKLVTWSLITKKAGKFTDFINHIANNVYRPVKSAADKEQLAAAVTCAIKQAKTVTSAIKKACEDKKMSENVFMVKVAKRHLEGSKKESLRIKLAFMKQATVKVSTATKIKSAYNLQYLNNVGYNALLNNDTDTLAKCVIGLAIEGTWGDEARQEVFK